MKYSTGVLIAVLTIGRLTTIASTQEALAPAGKTKVDPARRQLRSFMTGRLIMAC